MKKMISIGLLFLSLQTQGANPFLDFIQQKKSTATGPVKIPAPVIKPLSLGCYGSTLVNSKAVILYKFDYAFQCQDALNKQKNDLLCLNSSLKNIEGVLIHQFGYDFECKTALETINGPLFCAGSSVLSTTGALIHKFEYDFQCQESLEIFFNKTK